MRETTEATGEGPVAKQELADVVSGQLLCYECHSCIWTG